MLKSIEESPLYGIAYPKSIAFFGASNNISAMGTNQLISIQALGYEGDPIETGGRFDKLGLGVALNQKTSMGD